jgi:hypothetical protein
MMVPFKSPLFNLSGWLGGRGASNARKAVAYPCERKQAQPTGLYRLDRLVAAVRDRVHHRLPLDLLADAGVFEEALR